MVPSASEVVTVFPGVPALSKFTLSGVSVDVSSNGLLDGGEDACGKLRTALVPDSHVPLKLVFWMATGYDVMV